MHEVLKCTRYDNIDFAYLSEKFLDGVFEGGNCTMPNIQRKTEILWTHLPFYWFNGARHLTRSIGKMQAKSSTESPFGVLGILDE